MLGRAQQYMHGLLDYGVVIFRPVYSGEVVANDLLNAKYHRKYHFTSHYGTYAGEIKRIDVPNNYVNVTTTYIYGTCKRVAFSLSTADYMTYLSRRCRYYMCSLSYLYSKNTYIWFNIYGNINCDRNVIDKSLYTGCGSRTVTGRYLFYDGAILTDMMEQMATRNAFGINTSHNPHIKVVV